MRTSKSAIINWLVTFTALIAGITACLEQWRAYKREEAARQERAAQWEYSKAIATAHDKSTTAPAEPVAKSLPEGWADHKKD